MPLDQSRPYDIIVYGATGFTGKLVARHLRDFGSRVKFGIGGRSRSKLEQVVKEVGLAANTAIFVADSTDEPALRNLAKQTRALINVAGPYEKCGRSIVGAARVSHTAYFDITGEIPWVLKLKKEFDASPEFNTGSLVVTSCAYDSVPSDLGVRLAVQELKRVAGKDASAGRVSAAFQGEGGVSGGTVASAIGIASQTRTFLNFLTDPYFFSPVRGTQKPSFDLVFREPGLIGSQWPGSLIDGAVVRRTWGLQVEAAAKAAKDPKAPRPEIEYGPDFSFVNFMVVPHIIIAVIVSAVLGLGVATITALSAVGPLKRGLLRIVPQPGTGPSVAKLDRMAFKVLTTAHSSDNKTIVRSILRGQGDPGYTWGALAVAEAALTYVLDYDKIPEAGRQGGFLTPAFALGDPYVARLEATKRTTVSFETIKRDN